MYDLDSFPITPELADRIRSWQHIFDSGEPWDVPEPEREAVHVATAVSLARELKRQLPRCVVVALRNRVRDDLSLGEIVPHPGEHLLAGEKESRFKIWKRDFLNGKFRT